MARPIWKLDPLKVRNKKVPGCYGDGGGLYLQVGPTGGKSWLFRYTFQGKANNMGLGSIHTISLPEAREKALECRKFIQEGKDPKAERNADFAAQKLACSRMMTFQQCAEQYIKVQRAGWKNAKHASQWESTLCTYVYPIIGDLPVNVIDTDLVMKCLAPIWTTKTETASRVRSRIELVISWASANKYRQGENPARWRGHLDKLLPPPRKVTPVEHFPALPYEQIGTFMQALRLQTGTAARALEFLILTGLRSEVVREAPWEEFNFEKKIWIIPAERMKAPREHRVPLSRRALEILNEMKLHHESSFVFPGSKPNKPLSTLDPPMKRIHPNGITVHGFRSTFRDWAAETTAYPTEVAEMALAHAVSDKVEAAYRRGDLFNKRVRFMEDWSQHCENPSPCRNVVPIKSTFTV